MTRGSAGSRAGSPESRIVEDVLEGRVLPLYLIAGETVLAEKVGGRIAEALVRKTGAEPAFERRPVDLRDVLSDLRTYSLFGGAKVTVVVDSAVLSDRASAAYLVDQAAEVLPLSDASSLATKERVAAGRLLQVLRLFGIEPGRAASSETLSELPGWALQGGIKPGAKRAPARKRSKKQMESLAENLATLLDAALAEELIGWAEGDAADLGAVCSDGFPEGHHLVLCEAAVAKDHPVVEAITARGGLVRLETIEADRKGNWSGVRPLVEELAAETGARIDGQGLAELARRTLHQEPGWGPGSQKARSDTTARFAAEYRKLAGLADEGRIGRDLVVDVVKDRGEEDVFSILDAVGSGRSREALEKLRRLVEGAEDPMATRLQFFSQLAALCRQMTAIAGMMELASVPAGERNYNRFKSSYAPKLQQPVPAGGVSLLGGLHPYRLHRAYLAASRFAPDRLRSLPDRVLETEMRLKGESSSPDAALADLVAHLAGAA